jgi:hypothetical protein
MTPKALYTTIFKLILNMLMDSFSENQGRDINMLTIIGLDLLFKNMISAANFRKSVKEFLIEEKELSNISFIIYNLCLRVKNEQLDFEILYGLIKSSV